jgi:hypothetical protein
MSHKLGVIIPYRLRKVHLDIFVEKITEHLNNQNIDFEIIVINQDNAKQFNRGMLLNIGYMYAKKMKCDYLVFHDVDMIPIDVDYSYSDVPLHLATGFVDDKGEESGLPFDTYFGGVTMFPTEMFKNINGYSNKYWGWGYEDDDLLFRCTENNVPLDILKYKNQGKKGKVLRFYGKSSKIICDNVIDFNSSSTFYISFYPDDLECNHLRKSDEFTVFSVPGYDFAICYNSFSRYNFAAFDHKQNVLYVNSNIKTNYKTNIIVTLDRLDNIIKVYQDGEFIGETEPFKKLHFYKKEPKFYLGVGRPDREGLQNYYKGIIDSFAYYDFILNEDEIKEIATNSTNSLNENFGNYKSAAFLKTYYDTNHIRNYKLIDLSGNHNDGIIQDCGVENFKFEEYKEVKVPFRRKCKFELLNHEPNGFINNQWKDDATRWNQLRFYNEVYKNKIIEDGLNDLQFKEYGKSKIKNVTQVNIAI